MLTGTVFDFSQSTLNFSYGTANYYLSSALDGKYSHVKNCHLLIDYRNNYNNKGKYYGLIEFSFDKNCALKFDTVIKIAGPNWKLSDSQNPDVGIGKPLPTFEQLNHVPLVATGAFGNAIFDYDFSSPTSIRKANFRLDPSGVVFHAEFTNQDF